MIGLAEIRVRLIEAVHERRLTPDASRDEVLAVFPEIGDLEERDDLVAWLDRGGLLQDAAVLDGAHRRMEARAGAARLRVHRVSTGET